MAKTFPALAAILLLLAGFAAGRLLLPSPPAVPGSPSLPAGLSPRKSEPSAEPAYSSRPSHSHSAASLELRHPVKQDLPASAAPPALPRAAVAKSSPPPVAAFATAASSSPASVPAAPAPVSSLPSVPAVASAEEFVTEIQMPEPLPGHAAPGIPASLASLPSDTLSPDQQQEAETLAEDFVRRLEEVSETATDEEYLAAWNEAQAANDTLFKALYGTQAWLQRHNQAWIEANGGK